MENHFHLILDTPEASLVSGIKDHGEAGVERLVESVLQRREKEKLGRELA